MFLSVQMFMKYQFQVIYFEFYSFTNVNTNGNTKTLGYLYGTHNKNGSNREQAYDLFKDYHLETNTWQSKEYNNRFNYGRTDLSISAMIANEEKKTNSFRPRCKKGPQTIWNSCRRTVSFVDLFTDVRLLYLASRDDSPIIPFIIVLAVSLVSPHIVLYSCGVKLFFVNRDNNYI